ncbi:DUF6338 family protein [Geobacillus kaustophilus]|uniref:Hypothetical conserved protein n=1 Tax=Geobacillus kaustophilus (strain HTA426) TaxID=235909 RepID=Q5L2M1_GEOKA|nr:MULTISPECIES: DUF6338 family protein [Geobacillus thermoleovorans group]MBW7642430.1 hypothetical protein [Geobacillus thermoleovorans]BAD74809.1 hypothetical conserved protein [Geobacillus kaustophilus HTA426]
MESFISLLVFTLPGLLAYFWIQLFGLTPTVKHQSTEMLAISALLWIPVVITVLFVYQLLAYVSSLDVIHLKVDVPILKKDWTMINKLSDIATLSDNVWFLLYFVASSIIVSFYLAKFICKKGYKKFLDKVNQVRKENGLAPLSENTTVWNEVFLGNEGQVVEVYKIDKPDEKVIGCIKKVSRAFEPEKNIVLEGVEHWTKVMEHYEVETEDAFIDTKTGLVIKIYNLEQALEAQDLYNKKVSNSTTS